jgi:hypothetical protein
MSSVGQARLALPADLIAGVRCRNDFSALHGHLTCFTYATPIVAFSRRAIWRVATRYPIRVRPSWAHKAKRPA